MQLNNEKIYGLFMLKECAIFINMKIYGCDSYSCFTENVEDMCF